MYPNYFIVYDLETGGLITKDKTTGEKVIPPITEFACSILNNGLEVVEEIDIFIKPYKPDTCYAAEALKVSNITLDLCREQGIEAFEAAKKIIGIFKKAKAPSQGKKPVLCGHNIDSFDNVILDAFLSEFQQDLSKVVDSDFTIDTKWWGRMAYPDLPGFTLSDCLMRENIDNEQAHRAIGDVRANKELVVKMLQKLRGQGSLFTEVQPKESYRKSFRFQIARK